MEMSSNTEEKIKPVDPERFHQALGVYQAALAAEGAHTSPNPSSSNPVEKDGPDTADMPGNRGIVAVKKEFPDADEFQSLSLRLQRFAEVIGDRKLIKWGMVQHSEGGIEVHDAVVNALATAPFRKSGVLDKPAFHSLVKAEFTRLEAQGKG
jgi:hypothetical protein